MEKLVRESLNEAYRMGGSRWSDVLRDIKDESNWYVRGKKAKHFFNNDEDEERVLVLSCPSDNEYILVELTDVKGQVFDDNLWDAEGLSAGEITMDAWQQVDTDL